jgi:hypothetical protein
VRRVSLTGARLPIPRWYVVLELVARLAVDVATPHLPGAFHLVRIPAKLNTQIGAS